MEESSARPLQLESEPRYQHWGGLAATVAALDGFDASLQSDPALAALLRKLDLVDDVKAVTSVPSWMQSRLPRLQAKKLVD